MLNKLDVEMSRSENSSELIPLTDLLRTYVFQDVPSVLEAGIGQVRPASSGSL